MELSLINLFFFKKNLLVDYLNLWTDIIFVSYHQFIRAQLFRPQPSWHFFHFDSEFNTLYQALVCEMHVAMLLFRYTPKQVSQSVKT